MTTIPPRPDSGNGYGTEAGHKSKGYGYSLAEKHQHDEERLTQFLAFESKLNTGQQRLSPRERYILFLEENEGSLGPEERNLMALERRRVEAGHHEQ